MKIITKGVATTPKGVFYEAKLITSPLTLNTTWQDIVDSGETPSFDTAGCLDMSLVYDLTIGTSTGIQFRVVFSVGNETIAFDLPITEKSGDKQMVATGLSELKNNVNQLCTAPVELRGHANKCKWQAKTTAGTDATLNKAYAMFGPGPEGKDTPVVPTIRT